MYGRRTGRIKKIVRKWGVFMSAILKQRLIDIANGFTKYGLWKGGGSGGSSSLADMTDVSFSNLKENDALKYNGSVWVNGDDLHEYSTEEKIVGKWIDGKPIYEKVIYTDITDRNWHDIQMDVSVDNIIKLKGILYRGDNYFMELQGNVYPNNVERGMVYYNKNSNYISYVVLYSFVNLSYAYLYIIMQYTKTTD